MEADQPAENEPLDKRSQPRPARQEADPAWIGLMIVAFGFGLVGMGGYAGVRLVRDILPGFATRSWKETEGTIVKTWIERTDRTRSGPYWLVRVEYRYTVGGKEFINDRVGYGGGGIGGGGDEQYYRKEMQSKYPVGSKCSVFYDPADPREACLETGVSYLRLTILFLLAIGLTVGGVWLVIWRIRGSHSGTTGGPSMAPQT